MKYRKYKGPLGCVAHLMQNDPMLGQHLLDAHVIRTLDPMDEHDRNEIEAAKMRSEERRRYWINSLRK